MSEHPAIAWQRVAVVAVLATIGSILPAFLTGALGVQIGDDLDFGAGLLGLAVGAYFVGAALSSSVLGHVAERVGPERALRISTASSAVLMVAIALGARGYAILVVILFVAGVAQALGQPGANLMLARGTPAHRQGRAFAVKQSGMPAAALLGGAAVPLVGLTLGWRWAYVIGAVIALVAFVLVPPTGSFAHDAARSDGPVPTTRPTPLRPLLLLTIAVGLGAASAGMIVSFYVLGGVDAGMSEGAAGWALTLGSAFGISMRLWQGVLADRRGARHLPVVAFMLAIGVTGQLLLAFNRPLLYIVAIPLAFGAGWAWPGLFNLAIVRNYPDAPGAATGISQTGTYVGAMIGPIAFGGVVAATGSYSWGWVTAASCAASASIMMVIARAELLARKEGRRDERRDGANTGGSATR